MASCEPKRSSSYCEDLRWRMIWQREGLCYSYKVVARNLGVDKSTVKRTVRKFLQTGTVAKENYPAERAQKILTEPAKIFIISQVIEKPGIYLSEIQSLLEEKLYLDISLSTICKFLHKSGFTLYN